jgi:hypothetical protein
MRPQSRSPLALTAILLTSLTRDCMICVASITNESDSEIKDISLHLSPSHRESEEFTTSTCGVKQLDAGASVEICACVDHSLAASEVDVHLQFDREGVSIKLIDSDVQTINAPVLSILDLVID